MNNRPGNEGAQPDLNPQKPGQGSGDDHQRTRLILQRLKIEAALRHLDFATWVSVNQVMLKSKDHVAIITVSLTKLGEVTAQIRAILGQVMLIEEARAFAANKNPSIQPNEISVDEEGTVSVLWTETFAEDVNPSAVLTALKGIGGTAESIRPVLEEEFYLKQPACLS